MRHCTVVKLSRRVYERFCSDSVRSSIGQLTEIHTAPRPVRQEICMQATHAVTNSITHTCFVERKRLLKLSSSRMNLGAKNREESAKTSSTN